MNAQQKTEFVDTVWDYYHRHGRDLPWRQPDAQGRFDPYKIMVSEIMLQQTQAARVIPKYKEFLQLFPNVESLAQARLSEVLTVWNGLGYNRRAKFLWQAAQQLSDAIPKTAEAWAQLPGIGPNTAGAIVVYSFNVPAVFIETNIRTVYIHHFFADREQVPDAEIRELVEVTLDYEHPREWYWALMDYGTYLKSAVGNTSRLSAHYAKQSAFHGSRRQVRGKVLKLLIGSQRTFEELETEVDDERLAGVLEDLLAEQLIKQDGHIYTL